MYVCTWVSVCLIVYMHTYVWAWISRFYLYEYVYAHMNKYTLVSMYYACTQSYYV